MGSRRDAMGARFHLCENRLGAAATAAHCSTSAVAEWTSVLETQPEHPEARMYLRMVGGDDGAEPAS